MRSVTVTEAKAHLSRLLAAVRKGESILLLHRGRPIARLEPVRQREGEEWDRFQHLIRAGVLKPGTGEIPKALLELAPSRMPEGASLLDAVLDERREER